MMNTRPCASNQDSESSGSGALSNKFSKDLSTKNIFVVGNADLSIRDVKKDGIKEADMTKEDMKKNDKEECTGQRQNIQKNLMGLYSMTALIGNTRCNPLPKYIPVLGGLLWIGNMMLHLAFDLSESKLVYSYLWGAGQIMQFLTCITHTYFINFRTIPWFCAGLVELNEDAIYKETIKKVSKAAKVLPYAAVTFGVICAAMQYSLHMFDNSFHLTFGISVSRELTVLLHLLRFVCDFHVYCAVAIFWNVPVLIMLMSGFSMKDYMAVMDKRFRSSHDVPSFKEAIKSYSQRADFVKSSSASCMVSLLLLLGTGIITLALNAYMFFFKRRLFLYLLHAMLPLTLMVYPLASAAWVTKQYNWFIVIVVNAWIQRNDSDSEEEFITPIKKLQLKRNKIKEDGKDSPKHVAKSTGVTKKLDRNDNKNTSIFDVPERPRKFKSFTDHSESQKKDEHGSYYFSKSEENLEIQAPSSPFKLQSDCSVANIFKSAARAIGKLRKGIRPKFNFDKYLSYLESVRPVVGFTIGGVMVTWDLVSTIFFLLFSLVAVLVQESIFGSQKSTL